MVEIILRPMFGSDIEFLRRLRNANRKFFFDQNYISKDRHCEWIKNERKSKNSFIFIIDLIVKRIPNRIGTISLVNYKQKAKSAELGRFIITKAYRGRGLGCLVIEKFKSICRLLRVSKLSLCIRSDNKYTLDLYKKLGFRISKIDVKNGKITMLTRI